MTHTIATDLTRTDRAVLRTVQLGAWVGLAAAAALGTAGAISAVAGGLTAVRLAIYAAPPPTDSLTVVSGVLHRMEADVFVERVPPLVAGMAVAADLVRAIGMVLILLGIAMLASRMLRGLPFAGAAGTPLGLVLIGVAAGPTLADALDGWVSMGTFEAMGTPDGYAAVYGFDLAPIFLGMVVAALMIAFRIADRMQRETEGLV
jgi:hypothetical protein